MQFLKRKLPRRLCTIDEDGAGDRGEGKRSYDKGYMGDGDDRGYGTR